MKLILKTWRISVLLITLSQLQPGKATGQDFRSNGKGPGTDQKSAIQSVPGAQAVPARKQEDKFKGLGERVYATGLGEVTIQVLKHGRFKNLVYLGTNKAGIFLGDNQTGQINKPMKLDPGELDLCIKHFINHVRSDTKHLTTIQLETPFIIGSGDRNLDGKAHAIVRQIGPNKIAVRFEDTWNTPWEPDDVYFEDVTILLTGAVTMDESLPPLISATQNSNPEIAKQAMQALQKISPQLAMQAGKQTVKR